MKRFTYVCKWFVDDTKKAVYTFNRKSDCLKVAKTIKKKYNSLIKDKTFLKLEVYAEKVDNFDEFGNFRENIFYYNSLEAWEWIKI